MPGTWRSVYSGSCAKTLDRSAFRAIQTEFLSEPPTEPRVGHLKYIEPVIWTADKLATCLQLGLDEQQPLKMLDICTGPAHWQLAARHFGHSVVATELPELIAGIAIAAGSMMPCVICIECLPCPSGSNRWCRSVMSAMTTIS